MGGIFADSSPDDPAPPVGQRTCRGLWTSVHTTSDIDNRLARSVPTPAPSATPWSPRGKLSLGGTVYDPADPMGKLFFNILATFAEFEVDLLRLRTREGMAIARANGKLKGKPPKLTARQQTHLVKLHTAGEHTIPELAELFSVSRATVYRVLERGQ